MTRPTAPLNVLIVEDEALLAMDLEAMVEDTGHGVVALGEELHPDIAFVDIQLACGSSGIDVARLIGQRWPDTIIVFVTANPLKIPQDFAGAHGVIAKPFSRIGLLSAMHYIASSIIAPPATAPAPPSFIASAAFATAQADHP